MNRWSPVILAPLLCLGILGGIEVERLTQLQPADAVPYLQRSAAAIRAVPRGITIDGQPWSAMRVDVPESAVKLLGANETLSLHFTGRLMRQNCSADLLIVQCQDSRDMTGHYPPICYPGNGHTEVYRGDKGEVTANGLRVPFMEYHFEKESRGFTQTICIYNFFIVPGRGVVRDIQDLRDAAEDYQRRFFGAAQFQVVVSAELSKSSREEILQSLIAANGDLLSILNSAEVPAK